MSQIPMFPLKGGSPPTTLTSNISQTDTRLDVADVSVFPDIGDTNNLVSIWVSTTSGKVWEVCEYTAKVVTTSPAGYLTIIRSGTNHSSSSSGSALSWSSGAKCARNVNKLDFDKIHANIRDHETHIAVNTSAIAATADELSILASHQVTGGTGLSGGGPISSDVSLALDLSELDIVTSPVDDDYIPIFRSSGHKRIARSNLLGTDQEIFGFAWNTKSSSPVLTRIDQDGNTINPLQSKFNRHPLWGNIKRCKLTAAGIPSYGTDNKGAGLVTTTDYTMVEIPQVNIMDWADGDYLCFCMSNASFSGRPLGATLTSYVHPWFYQRGNTTPASKGYVGAYKASGNTSILSSKSGVTPLVNITMAQFETAGNAIGTGWGVANFHFQSLLQLLMYTEYGTLDIQSALGPGFTNASNTGPQTCGANDSLMNTYGSGGGSDTQGVNYRGLNNPYGDIWEFRPGYNSLDDRFRVLNRIGVGTTVSIPSTLGTTGIEDTTGVTPITSVNGYISSILQVDPLKLSFIPSGFSGSGSTFLCDMGYSHVAGQVGCLLAGGTWSYAGGAGPGYLSSYNAVSIANSLVGARLEFLKA